MKLESKAREVETWKQRDLELDEAMGVIQQMQMAINAYHADRSNLRFCSAQAENGQVDVLVTKHGIHWHLEPDCQFLSNAGATKVL